MKYITLIPPVHMLNYTSKKRTELLCHNQILFYLCADFPIRTTQKMAKPLR